MTRERRAVRGGHRKWRRRDGEFGVAEARHGISMRCDRVDLIPQLSERLSLLIGGRTQWIANEAADDSAVARSLAQRISDVKTSTAPSPSPL